MGWDHQLPKPFVLLLAFAKMQMASSWMVDLLQHAQNVQQRPGLHSKGFAIFSQTLCSLIHKKAAILLWIVSLMMTCLVHVLQLDSVKLEPLLDLITNIPLCF